LEIEATIELEVWMENAPELFKVDQDWIISETRANAAIFYPNGEAPNSEIENFEVDEAKIYFKVS
jgi:hypothetical protein